MAWVHDCNERGLRIYAQGANVRSWFHFTLENWSLYDSSPAWNHAIQGSVEDKLAKLSDPEIRKAMREEHEMLKTVGRASMPESLKIVGTPGHPELEKYIGQIVGDMAKAEGKHPTDVMIDIAIAGGLKVEFRTAPPFSENPDLVGPLMSDPYVIAGVSDGGAHTKFFTGGSFTTDFLTWLVRDTGKVSLEEAHYHLSYLPAQAAG